ncbi:MAG: hypothetical protein KJ749_08340 [Planctomycetes bacterium]|nr:hypothetical protein [Planctomycetota bacterium]
MTHRRRSMRWRTKSRTKAAVAWIITSSAVVLIILALYWAAVGSCSHS